VQTFRAFNGCGCSIDQLICTAALCSGSDTETFLENRELFLALNLERNSWSIV
jgi:hypothetical protein